MEEKRREEAQNGIENLSKKHQKMHQKSIKIHQKSTLEERKMALKIYQKIIKKSSKMHQKSIKNLSKSIKNRPSERGPEKTRKILKKVTLRIRFRLIQFGPFLVQNGIKKSLKNRYRKSTPK